MLLAILLSSLPASARPQKGFHTGPYLQVVTGAVDASFDRNLVSNTRTGRDQEVALGFLFGWHTSDHFGPFLEVRYSTDLNSERRLHVVNGNIGVTYTLILDALTRFKSLRILPFVGGDLLFRIDALPSDPSVGSGLVNRYAIGPGVMGGINVLFKRYVYIGALFQEDYAHFYSRSQTIGGASTVVYGSGWHPQWSASLNTGFHF
jgi:hypothetical protein